MRDEPDLIRLVAIARGLEDEGRYLAARLFRAAARGEEARRSDEHPRSNEELAHAIEGIIPRLEAARQDSALVAAMRRVAAMLRSSEDRFEGDMAELHVCRTCGWAMVGPAPAQCPSCGGGVLSFEHVLPIYFLERSRPVGQLLSIRPRWPSRAWRSFVRPSSLAPRLRNRLSPA